MSSTSNNKSDDLDPVLQQFYHQGSNALIIDCLTPDIHASIQIQAETVSMMNMFSGHTIWVLISKPSTLVLLCQAHLKSHLTSHKTRGPIIASKSGGCAGQEGDQMKAFERKF
jgi:hypothetical protein